MEKRNRRESFENRQKEKNSLVIKAKERRGTQRHRVKVEEGRSRKEKKGNGRKHQTH